MIRKIHASILLNKDSMIGTERDATFDLLVKNAIEQFKGLLPMISFANDHLKQYEPYQLILGTVLATVLIRILMTLLSRF
jgi:hypothetical protein